MAATDDGATGGAAKKKGGPMGLLVPVLVLTLLAGGGGWLIGTQIVSAIKRADAPAAAPELSARKDGEGAKDEKGKEGGKEGAKGDGKAEGHKGDGKAADAGAKAPDEVAVRELTPVVTNLASPDNASWVRLQAAIVFNKSDGPQMDLLAAKVGDDILSALRSLTLAQLQGSAGLDLLREDLNERAAIRSDGHIRELVIEMLVVQ